jgi:DNA-binding NtrC family response regulator
MSTAKKILIVDDDDQLRETLKEQFALHGEFSVLDAATATAGLKMVRGEHIRVRSSCSPLKGRTRT